MPVPTPNAGESREDFMGRCVSFLTDEGKPQDQAVAICASQWGKDINPFPRSEDEKTMFWKAFDSRRWGFLGWAQSRFRRALLEQASQVRDTLGRTGSVSAAIGTLESISEEPIRSAFIDVYGKVGSYFAGQIYSSFKAQGVAMQTKQDESMFERFIREWVRIQGASRILGITRTTRGRIRVFLEQAIEQGLGAEEAARLLADNSRIIGIQRARVIARTEIISASNRGSLHGAEQTNLNLEKEWISTRDGRTRRIPDDKADHFTIDGQTVDLDKPFQVPNIQRGMEFLMFPGDPSGSPETTIMCRCTQGYRRK